MSPASEFTRPFWEAVADGRLLVPECTACGRRFFKPEPLCTHCGSAGWLWVPSPGTGAVYSVSVVHQPVNNDHEVPFALAIVDLDDDWTMLTHIVGCARTRCASVGYGWATTVMSDPQGSSRRGRISREHVHPG
jgi:uncharacterized OB-fold protein